MGYIQDSINQGKKSTGVIKIPLGTIRPWFSYYNPRTGKTFVPQEDVVYLRLRFADGFSLMMIMPPGAGKSRLLKRMLPYFEKEGTKIIVFDCKGFEMYFAKFKTDKYKELFPWETPMPMNMVSYIPGWVKKKIDMFHLNKNPENKYLDNFSVFSYQLKDIKDVLECSTLGIAPTARMIFLDLIKRNIEQGLLRTTEDVLRFVKSARINQGSKENLMNVFSFFANQQFFDERYKPINVGKEWRRGNSVNISLLEPQEEQASFYAGKVISDLYEQDAASGHSKLVVIDDASKLLGARMKQDEYLSVQQVIDLIALGRYKKWGIMVSSQAYDILNPDTFALFKYKIVGKLGASDLNYLSKFCSPDVTFAIKTLQYDPTRHLNEMLLIYPDNMTYTKFYAWGSLCYHK